MRWKAMRDVSVCLCPQCPPEDSPKICGICVLPGKLSQNPKRDTKPWGGERAALWQCRHHIDSGDPGPASISLGTSSAERSSARGHKCRQRWEKPKGMRDSAVGLMELGQGVAFCKRVALMSPLPEVRGCSWSIQRGGCAHPIPPLLSRVLLQRCMAGMMRRRQALLSPFLLILEGGQRSWGMGGIIESLRLEKTSKVLKSNVNPSPPCLLRCWLAWGVRGATQLWDVLV